MRIKDSNILITGGSGFIGSNLAEALVKRGSNVTIFDLMLKPYGGNKFNISKIKNKIKFVNGDVRSKGNISRALEGSDIVYHLAAQTGRSISMENPKLDVDINLVGTLNVLEGIRKMKKKPKLIFAGSRGVIGKPEYLPVDEHHHENPRDVYGINKLAAENLVLLYGKEYGFHSTSLRLNNVYGPRCQVKSNHYGTVNLFISYALRNIVLPIYGTGEQTRDYIYVDDVVDAFIKAVSPKADGKYFFVGTGIPVSLIEIVDILKKYIPTTKAKLVPFPKTLKSVDFPEFYSTSEKITGILGWKPKISIEEGIFKTVEFYRKNLKHYV